ncbi:hypothetical protein SLS56_011558 [Neofusicoccum ribis]|uniref:Uncharacterized protein n=1 Tax=Neofusicoccum ribis TaxID=45134 RepID=A0ABR3SBC7_9PEZI
MPTRNRSSPAQWLFRDHSVLVQASDKSWGSFALFFKSDQRKRALISVRLLAELQGFDHPQSLTLSIRPEDIAQCDVSAANALPPEIKNQLVADAAITADADVLVFSVSLKCTGRVIAPATQLPLSPKEHFRSQFLPFYSLCQSESFLFYFPKEQIQETRVQRLEELIGLAQAGKLCSFPLDVRRLGGGKGVQETDWRVFHVPETPPPYVAADAERDRSLHTSCKRPRAGGQGPRIATSDDERTHVSDSEASLSQQWTNTTSTPSSPAQRTHVSKSQLSPPEYGGEKSPRLPQSLIEVAPSSLDATEHFRQSVRQIIRDVLPDALREVLPEALLRSASSRELFDEKLELLLADRVDSRLETLVDAKLPAIVQEKIGPEVDEQLGDQLADVQDSNELRLNETVEDALVEIKATRDECVKDMEEVRRETVAELEMEARQIKDDAAISIADRAETMGRVAELKDEHLARERDYAVLRQETQCAGLRTSRRAASV